jgi:hypothetical protein
MGHPVGTGPFKLTQWRRSSFIALERNPEYREVLYDAEPAAGDAEGQAILKRLKGQAAADDRPGGDLDHRREPAALVDLPEEGHRPHRRGAPRVHTQAMPGGKVAPNLAKQGVQGWRMVRSDVAQTFFNMDDPLVGGYTPDKVALRRAIFLAVDVEREINLVRRGQAVVAQARSSRTRWPMTPSSGARTASTACPRHVRCSTCSATSTGTATAGATCPTARRWC